MYTTAAAAAPESSGSNYWTRTAAETITVTMAGSTYSFAVQANDHVNIYTNSYETHPAEFGWFKGGGLVKAPAAAVAPKAMFPLNKQPGKADAVLDAQLRTLIGDAAGVNHSEAVPKLKGLFGGFDSSTSAQISVAGLVFWSNLSLTAADVNKSFNGDVWGIGGAGGESL